MRIKVVVSFLLALVSFVLTFDFLLLMKITLPHFPTWNIAVAGLSLFFSVIIWINISAYIKQRSWHPRISDEILLFSSALMNLLVLLSLFVVVVFNKQIKDLAYGGGRLEAMVARRNLRMLYRNMRMYADTFGGQYPVNHEWCDLLAEHCNADVFNFGSPYYEGPRSYHITDPNTDPNVSMNLMLAYEYLNPEGVQKYVYNVKMSAYALNPDCEPNSPGQTVLVFGTETGWNQYGGPELMKFEHSKGRRCIVLRNDGKIGFVRPEEVGNLKWNVEDVNNVK